jgi:hypothetical protein
MNLELFKSKLSKGQLEAMAIDTVRKQMENVSPMESLIFAKKLKYFTDVLLKEAETEAKQVWDNEKESYPNCTYNDGGFLLDYDQDPVHKELSDKRKERKELLNAAFKIKEYIVDEDGVQVPKVKIKSYRKPSIHVKL